MGIIGWNIARHHSRSSRNWTDTILRDDSLVYENKQIDNIRRSLIKDSRVNELINIAKEIFNLKNKGSRAFEHGLVEYSDLEAEQLRSLQLSMVKLQIAIQKSVPGRNGMCRCGSGKSSKKCCYR